MNSDGIAAEKKMNSIFYDALLVLLGWIMLKNRNNVKKERAPVPVSSGYRGRAN